MRGLHLCLKALIPNRQCACHFKNGVNLGLAVNG